MWVRSMAEPETIGVIGAVTQIIVSRINAWGACRRSDRHTLEGVHQASQHIGKVDAPIVRQIRCVLALQAMRSAVVRSPQIVKQDDGIRHADLVIVVQVATNEYFTFRQVLLCFLLVLVLLLII